MKHLKQYNSTEPKTYKKYVVITHTGWSNNNYVLRTTENAKNNEIFYDKFYYYDQNFVFNESDVSSDSKYILDDDFHIVYQSNNLKSAIDYMTKKMEIERDSNKFNL